MNDYLKNCRIPFYTREQPGRYWGYTNEEAYELDRQHNLDYFKEVKRKFHEYLAIPWSQMWSPSHHMMGAQKPHPGPHFLETFDKLVEYYELRGDEGPRAKPFKAWPERRKAKGPKQAYPITEDDAEADQPLEDFVPTFHEDYDESDDIQTHCKQ